MFNERLQKLRKKQTLTLEQLANQVGSTKSYIWELENKPDKKPSADLVSKLAKELKTTVEYLIDGSGSDQDAVFFREYKGLQPETKVQLQNIMDALKKGS
jgi:transcriptional regulator with XRE-family HTH domain